MSFHLSIQVYSIADGLKTNLLVGLIRTPKSAPQKRIFITWEAKLASFSSPATPLISTGGALHRGHTSLVNVRQRKLCSASKAIAKFSGRREALFKKFTSTHEVRS